MVAVYTHNNMQYFQNNNRHQRGQVVSVLHVQVANHYI